MSRMRSLNKRSTSVILCSMTIPRFLRKRSREYCEWQNGCKHFQKTSHGYRSYTFVDACMHRQRSVPIIEKQQSSESSRDPDETCLKLKASTPVLISAMSRKHIPGDISSTALFCRSPVRPSTQTRRYFCSYRKSKGQSLL